MSKPNYLSTVSGERVIRTVRKHWVNFAPVVVSCAALVLALVAISYLSGRFRDQIARVIPLSLIGLIIAVGFILVALIAGLGYWTFTQNQIILTNYHLCQITQNGLFNRTISQLSLAKIQDVSGTRKGPLATMLGFGDITIETAGEEDNFVFHQVPQPYELAKQIMLAHEAISGESPSDAVSE